MKNINTTEEQVIDENVIEVNEVGMEFTMPKEKVDNLKEFFVRLVKGKLEKEKQKILEDITFSVKKGESIALLGHNGAGKSTMLKILSGIYKPTKGTVKVKGKVAPLLNLGAGFDHEASAKENVYLNGAILGYSNKELHKKYEEIVEFAELHDYMNVPIKNFSSGMVARLGFAIAINVEPDILLVDEILSVGDENFRKKCANKIKELKEKGITFVIVSHNMDQVKSLCQKAVWIENAQMMDYGNVDEIVEKYKKYCEGLKH